MPRWKLLVFIISTGVVAGLLGTGAGTIYGKIKSNARERIRIQEKQEFLLSNVTNLEIGSPFPHIPLRDLSSGTAVTIADILPGNGLLFYVSADCPSCYDALLQLDQAVRESPKVRDLAVLIGGDAEEMVAHARLNNVDLRLYEDAGQVLMRQYHVLVFPTYLQLDQGHVIRGMGADVDQGESFRKLITQ